MEQVTGQAPTWQPPGALYAAWALALIGTVGSLFFSEVLLYPPCVLCWYQRIALYPLVVLIAVGIIKRDPSVVRFGLPLSIIGLLIAAYHNLLYYGLIPESITPCTEGVPCNAKQIELLGFITIPLMALGGFLCISVLLMLAGRKRNL